MPLKGIKIEWKFWLSDETTMNNIADKKNTNYKSPFWLSENEGNFYKTRQ